MIGETGKRIARALRELKFYRSCWVDSGKIGGQWWLGVTPSQAAQISNPW